ncbi:hypothetical protein M422DRAFT_271458 [Sphaerobolus stellatus SS14]|uniref:Uncharacterized protein n=1 Tax=Sphaerobolus stellatus (strain SS14) TaxID=990650 RepID=A0A0C9UEI4_SPHS4|nr:hypothetical protein M422DRAFT_271458 [Sphaerobolus stellatus SS14]
MLPPPPSPAPKTKSSWELRVPRDAAFIVLRNNLGGLLGVFLFNWFIPIYPYLKRVLLPSDWQYIVSVLDKAFLALLFGLNIIVALVSIRWPRTAYPPIRTPKKLPPPPNNTPVRLPVKNLGASPFSASKSLNSSGYASTPASPAQSRLRDFSITSSTSTPLNQSGFSSLSASASMNSSPLAAYRGRHPRTSGRAVDFQILRDFTTEADESY